MLIAICIALGIEAATILLLLVVLVLVKRIKTVRHPAVFKVRVRLVEGHFPGVSAEWKKGYAAWVTNVLTLRKGIGLNISDVLPTTTLVHIRDATSGEAESLRLGDNPAIATLSLSTGARIDLAVAAEQRAVGLKPYEAQAAQPASRSSVRPASLETEQPASGEAATSAG
jgi:hypothetical protein